MRTIGAVVLAGCVMLGGCLEFEQTVTLAPDGSGSQDVRLTLRDSVLAELERAAPAAAIAAVSSPKAVFDRELVRGELATAGLEMLGHEVTREGGLATVDLKARFKDFSTLQKSPLGGSAAEWVVARGPKPGTLKLTLYPQGKEAWQQARERARVLQGEVDPVAEDFFRKRQQQLAGLDVTVRFRLPGDVLVWTNNMEKTGDREVTARITAQQIKTPQDLVRRLAPRFEVIFDASGCTLLD